MLQTMLEIKQTLTQAADVRTCVIRHPWIATGSAVAAGLAAGAVLSTPRYASGAKHPAETAAGTAPDSLGHEPRPRKAGFVRAALGTALTGSVQTLLQSFIAAAIVAKEADPDAVLPQRPGSSPPVVPESVP